MRSARCAIFPASASPSSPASRTARCRNCFLEKIRTPPGTITAITRVLNCSLDELLNTHPSEIFSSEEIKRIRKFRSLSAHGKRMVDIVLDEEYHRFLEQMYREEKINAFNLVDDIRQLSYEQIAKASRYVRALKNGFSE